jgi:FkbM family methyltransferase
MEITSQSRSWSSILRRDATAGLLVLAAAAGCLAMGCAGRTSGGSKRYVFIDGGAHFGESYSAFQKCRLYPDYPWEIIAVEANPKLLDRLPRAPRLTVIGKAMWTSNGKLDFLMESDTSGRNSAIRSNFSEVKIEGELQTVSVDSFDVSEWLEKSFSVEDYVILSLDIEGAEYAIIDKMLEKGTVKYIDRLYVEFHWNVLEIREGIDRVRAIRQSRQLLRQVEKQGVMVGDDSVEGIMMRGTWTDFLL